MLMLLEFVRGVFRLSATVEGQCSGHDTDKSIVLGNLEQYRCSSSGFCFHVVKYSTRTNCNKKM